MYSLSWAQRIDTWVPAFFLLGLWALMQWNKKLPSTDSVQEFVAVVNSRGGNIIVLAIASIYFFKYSMYTFMHLLSMVKDKTITESNAFGLMAIQFVTTSAFGGAMGALLKTMTGESSKVRSSDGNGNGNGHAPDSVVKSPVQVVQVVPAVPVPSDQVPAPPTV